MTTEPPDHWRAVRQACATAGLDATGARMIHHYSNVIYVLPAASAVARVTYGADAADRVTRSQAITRWLSQERRFPATRSLDGTSPVTVDSAVVSFWTYYPQPEAALPLTSRHLAILLRLLHQAGPPPVSLPAWVPLEALEATAGNPSLSAALTSEERARIIGQVTDMRDQVAGLDWPLGTGMIHGDAWAGNLLACPGTPPAGVVLGDWDWVSSGPREVDLIPTWHAVARYGKPASWVRDFTRDYGHDLAQWAGYPVLMRMRDLVQLTGPIRRAHDSEPHCQALRQRLGDLRSGDTTSVWAAL
jgi:hypothetical protein